MAQFVHMEEAELQRSLLKVVDPHLKHSLNFGIGMHHAGERSFKLITNMNAMVCMCVHQTQRRSSHHIS